MPAHRKREARLLIAETSDALSGIASLLASAQPTCTNEVHAVKEAQTRMALSFALEACVQRLEQASLILD